MIASLAVELYRRNRILALAGWLHVLLLAGALFGWAIDERQVLGINTWIKPAKFMFSLAVYLWTIAWFSAYVAPRWLVRTISAVIAAVIAVESACILLQGARATTSHFNVATAFDAAIFQTMGIMIGIDMLMSFLVLLMFLRPAVRLASSYLWGIRAGFVLFLLGGAVGGVMIANSGHTVGAPDGGPALPLLNWSTVAGDLRLAHGMALHGLQVLPLLGYGISRWSLPQSKASRLELLAAGVIIYSGMALWLYLQAMAGIPLVGA